MAFMVCFRVFFFGWGVGIALTLIWFTMAFVKRVNFVLGDLGRLLYSYFWAWKDLSNSYITTCA